MGNPFGHLYFYLLILIIIAMDHREAWANCFGIKYKFGIPGLKSRNESRQGRGKGVLCQISSLLKECVCGSHTQMKDNWNPMWTWWLAEYWPHRRLYNLNNSATNDLSLSQSQNRFRRKGAKYGAWCVTMQCCGITGGLGEGGCVG